MRRNRAIRPAGSGGVVLRAVVPRGDGHYPGAVGSVKRMFPVKALLVALPLALGGAWLLYAANGRVAAFRAEMAELDAASRREGASCRRRPGVPRGEVAQRVAAELEADRRLIAGEPRAPAPPP